MNDDEPWAVAEKYADGFILAEYTGETARYCGRSMKWRRPPIVGTDDVFVSEAEALAAYEIFITKKP